MADSDAAEINRLYWETDSSIGEIEDTLGVSRRAIYDAIHPLPAGVDCPDCGEPLAFRNRTQAEAREAECAACGLERKVPSEIPPHGADSPADPRLERGWDASRATEATFRAVPLPAEHRPQATALVLAGLVAGVMLGLLLRRH